MKGTPCNGTYVITRSLLTGYGQVTVTILFTYIYCHVRYSPNRVGLVNWRVDK